MDPTPIIETELAVLDEVVAVLDAEAQALRDLDYRNIDLATEAKLELDARLAALQAERAGATGPIDPALRERYRARMEEVRLRVDANNHKLQVTAKTVQELVRTLTGGTSSSYGRRGYATGPASAVLTSTVG